jgi:hypothetical protein
MMILPTYYDRRTFINGTKIAEDIKREVAAEVATLKDRASRLFWRRGDGSPKACCFEGEQGRFSFKAPCFAGKQTSIASH